MMAHVIPFPAARRPFTGTVCVMGDRIEGFQVAHESSSGDSWGSFEHYATGQEAISAAYALNRDTYNGECDVHVCDAALQDACPDVGLPSLPGNF